jgi:hypothetical protein
MDFYAGGKHQHRVRIVAKYRQAMRIPRAPAPKNSGNRLTPNFVNCKR